MKKAFKQTIAVFIALLLPFQGVGIAPAFAQASPSMVTLSPVFAPAVLRGIKVDPQNPFHFNFVLDNGQSKLAGENLKSEGTKLIKYFLASLTLPENDLWVNLSPYEKDRIITNEFGQTEMGRQLLSEDYLLKKLSASLLHPDAETGKKFWAKVRKITAQKLGTTDVTMDTFNRIWIMPDKAVVYQDQGTAFIGETHLKVLLEEDYKALTEAKGSISVAENSSTQIFRDEVLPIIEQEVNEGENFASLRQIYHSLILASWYKRTLKQSLLSQIYVDQKKTAGVETDDKDAKQKIYEQYLETFKKGVYNLIREEQDDATGEMIPRKYFSGGVTLLIPAIETRPLSAASAVMTGDLLILDTNAQGFTADAVASIDVKRVINKTELTDWLGADLLQRFEQLNRGKKLPFVRVQVVGQNTQEDVSALQNALDQFTDPEEWVAVILQGDIKRRSDEESPWFFNLYVDQVKNFSAPVTKQGMVTAGGINLNIFELGLSFGFYPATRTLYFDKISFGKSTDVRGQGLMRETLSKIALNFANYFEGQYILSMISSDATRKWFNKNFSTLDRSRPGYYSFIGDIFFDLRINPGEMASPRLMIGVIPGKEFVAKPTAVAGSAVNSLEMPLKSSIGEIRVEFNNVIDSFTTEDQDDRAVARSEIEYLQAIVGKLVEREIAVRPGIETGKSISVESLAVSNGHRVFLVSWGSQRYAVKRSKGELYNKFIQNDWEILSKLNPDPSKRRPDIARPVLYGEEPLTRVEGDSRPLTAYLVTEYLDGEDLSEAIKPPRGPLNLSEVVNLGINLSETVEYVNEQGIIIRDINPPNIKMLNNGKIALYDFDVSLLPGYDWDKDENEFKYTAMNGWNVEDRDTAPEDRIRPKVQTDVFSIGMTLLRASIDTFYWAENINIEEALSDVEKVDPELKRIIAKAISPRWTRYKNALELKADLLARQAALANTLSASSSVEPLTQADFRNWEEFADFFTANNGVSPAGWWVGFDVDKAGAIEGERPRQEVLKKLSTALLRQVGSIDGAALFKSSQTQKRYLAEEGYVFLPDSISREELQAKLDAIRTEFTAQTRGSNKYTPQTVSFAVLPSRNIEGAALSKYGTVREQQFLDPGLRWQRVVTKVLDGLLREAKDDTAQYGNKTVFYSASSAVLEPAIVTNDKLTYIAAEHTLINSANGQVLQNINTVGNNTDVFDPGTGNIIRIPRPGWFFPPEKIAMIVAAGEAGISPRVRTVGKTNYGVLYFEVEKIDGISLRTQLKQQGRTMFNEQELDLIADLLILQIKNNVRIPQTFNLNDIFLVSDPARPRAVVIDPDSIVEWSGSFDGLVKNYLDLQLGLYWTQVDPSAKIRKRLEAFAASSGVFQVIQMKMELPRNEIEAISLDHLEDDIIVPPISNAITPPFDRESRVTPQSVALQLKTAFEEKAALGLPQDSVRPDLEGAEILIAGPGKGINEIRSFIEAYPGKIKAIHLIDASADVMRSIEQELVKYKGSGVQMPAIYGYVANLLELPADLEGRIDVIYSNDVLDRNYFSNGQKRQFASEAQRTLKTGGVIISAGISSGWMSSVDAPGFRVEHSTEGGDFLGFGYGIKVASSAVNDVIKTPAGDINVEFKDVIGYFTSKDQNDRKVVQLEIPYLRTILTKLIEKGIPAGVSAEGGAQMTVESLYANISNRLFLVNWGGKKFVIKSAQGNYYNDQLRNEAVILNRLNPGPDHPRADIAKVVLTGEEPLEIVSGMNPARAYMVTEYIEGEDLARILEKRWNLNVEDVVKLGIQLADSVGYAHDNGIVIRDVRPHNIRMKKDGTIALFDFNVSLTPEYDWAQDPDKLRYSLRYNWEVEDRGAHPPLRLRPDVMTDIFSIGMTLLQARVHMIGVSTEAQVRWMFGDVENAQLEEIIAKAVGLREKRYKNTAELKADLVALEQSMSEEKVAASSAVNENGDVGGIDLTEKNMNLDLRGQAGTFMMPTDPAQIQNIRIDGLVPVILNVTPLPSLPVFLKLSQAQTAEPPQLSLQN